MVRPTYDVIVLGLGGMGSAALFHLARRGVRVCGVEQFGVAHDMGSSHGSTRIIRKSYFEHPDYVPLLERAYSLWQDLEQESGRELLVESGLILSGRPDSALIQGLDACYAAHQLPHERIAAEEACRRYPPFSLPPDHVVYVDPIGGYLFVEACVEAHVALAQRHGADVYLHEDVLEWEANDSGVRLTTSRGTLRGGKLVITAGAWTRDLFDELAIPFTVLRKVQLWYDSPGLRGFRAGEFPCFYVDTPYGAFYGFPALSEQGIKVAEHSGGDVVDDPDKLNRGLESDDETKILRFLGETFPAFQPRRTRFSVCMYSMTPDQHFIIDRHPRFPNVVIAGGFSGHGFKFACVVGEILAGLALDGSTPHAIGFLGLDRFTPAVQSAE